VVQEALANAHKHGRAEHKSVELARRPDGLWVKVVDDGHAPQLQIVAGIGIPGMEARIERFGGTLSVTPSPAGTTVSAFIPAVALEDVADRPRGAPTDHAAKPARQLSR
jgi:signal transduction histidine kinase